MQPQQHNATNDINANSNSYNNDASPATNSDNRRDTTSPNSNNSNNHSSDNTNSNNSNSNSNNNSSNHTNDVGRSIDADSALVKMDDASLHLLEVHKGEQGWDFRRIFAGWTSGAAKLQVWEPYLLTTPQLEVLSFLLDTGSSHLQSAAGSTA